MAYPKMGEITDKFVGQPYDLNSVLSPAKVWEKLDAQSEEVRVFTNSLIDLLNSTGEDNWLYTAIVNAILGQITDGSLTDVKLSDAEGQIKERLTSFIATYDALVATKGIADGLATLDSSGDVPASQLDNTPKQYVAGTYIGDGSASRVIDLGFSPSAVFIIPSGGYMGDATTVLGGLAIVGNAVYLKGRIAIAVASNGFTVRYESWYDGVGYGVYTNDLDDKFHYVAWK